MEGGEAGTQTQLRKINSRSNYEDNAKGSPGLLSQICHGLLCTSLVNNYSSKYKGIIGRKLLEVPLCQAMSSPSLAQSVKHDCKKALRKKWQPKNPKVEKHSFHVLLAPRMSCGHLPFFFLVFFSFARFFFRVMHKELSERGTTLSLFLSCTVELHTHIFY